MYAAGYSLNEGDVRDSDNQTSPTWPAPNNITEQHANSTCRLIILSSTFISPECYGRLGNATSAAAVVQECIDDVQVII